PDECFLFCSLSIDYFCIDDHLCEKPGTQRVVFGNHLFYVYHPLYFAECAVSRHRELYYVHGRNYGAFSLCTHVTQSEQGYRAAEVQFGKGNGGCRGTLFAGDVSRFFQSGGSSRFGNRKEYGDRFGGQPWKSAVQRISPSL